MYHNTLLYTANTTIIYYNTLPANTTIIYYNTLPANTTIIYHNTLLYTANTIIISIQLMSIFGLINKTLLQAHPYYIINMD